MRLVWILPCVLGSPLLAQEQATSYDDSIILSKLIIAPSQNHRIKKLSCEMAGVFSRGSLVSKNVELTLEAESQGATFHCGHSLDQNTLVLGIRGEMQQSLMDADVVRYENLTSGYQPYLAFQLAPNVSLAMSQDIETGEYKTQLGNYSSTSQRMVLSGSWHQDAWEITLLYADRYRDSIIPSADKPRSLAATGRYQFSPGFTAGLVLTRSDYPGIASGTTSPEFEFDTAFVVTTPLTESLMTEWSYVSSKNVSGEKNSQAQILGLAAQLALNEKVKVGGFLTQYNGDSPDYKTTLSAYGFHVSRSR